MLHSVSPEHTVYGSCEFLATCMNIHCFFFSVEYMNLSHYAFSYIYLVKFFLGPLLKMNHFKRMFLDI